MLHLKLTSNLCKRILTTETISVYNRKMSSSVDDVLFEEKGKKGVIILNRPKALNALNLSMIQKILPTLIKWEKEKEVVLVKGTGEKAFCAGGDVKAITLAGLKGEKLGHEFFKWEYRMNALIGRFKQPYIALIDGITMGGGVGLSVHGRYRICTERTLFAMPETAIGLFPDVGGSYFLPQLEGKLGLYLALTGYRLKGIDVKHAGIATHYVDSTCLPEIEKELLDENTKPDDVSTVLEKYSATGKEFSLCPYIDQINEYFGASTIEKIISKLEEDDSEWAKKQVETLSKMSPTSMKVSKALLEKSKGLDLDECMKLEYRVAINTLNGKEFYEGVRALLIDKDLTPKWSPSKLEDVTDVIVESHFKSLPADQELKHKL